MNIEEGRNISFANVLDVEPAFFAGNNYLSSCGLGEEPLEIPSSVPHLIIKLSHCTRIWREKKSMSGYVI
ncbi:hypothetical protein L6452_19368 [Arctium lappa]|uniref:Uncharacterized protein n=1 Tax=Arctium lappa TaxID=4217 RepID=A0ACB9B999_ARCLA|nr:hypothetical protein L6452_19368 [Arctium lappa]